MAVSAVVKGGYWESWNENLPPAAIDTSFFTHIYYAFLVPNEESCRLVVNDCTGTSLRNFTSTLHQKNPSVKLLLSIGGGAADPQLFARMASNAVNRATFIASSMEVARNYGFDGLDLDWEFPTNQTEMEWLGLLLQEWRAEVNLEAQKSGLPRLLLAAATHFRVYIAYLNNSRYPVDLLGKNLDLINLMCYEYRLDNDETATGAHAALHDPNSNNVSTEFGVNSWIGDGAPRNKLVMGLPLFARTWKLKDPANHGIGAPAALVSPKDGGEPPYARVEALNEKNNAMVVYDDVRVATYSYAGTRWMGYDDTRSVREKVKYARTNRLGGYFFWSINGDRNWMISRIASEAWNED